MYCTLHTPMLQPCPATAEKMLVCSSTHPVLLCVLSSPMPNCAYGVCEGPDDSCPLLQFQGSRIQSASKCARSLPARAAPDQPSYSALGGSSCSCVFLLHSPPPDKARAPTTSRPDLGGEDHPAPGRSSIGLQVFSVARVVAHVSRIQAIRGLHAGPACPAPTPVGNQKKNRDPQSKAAHERRYDLGSAHGCRNEAPASFCSMPRSRTGHSRSPWAMPDICRFCAASWILKHCRRSSKAATHRGFRCLSDQLYAGRNSATWLHGGGSAI